MTDSVGFIVWRDYNNKWMTYRWYYPIHY